MPSLLKTAFLQLNKWAGNEYPKREDFVSDNEKIDAFADDISSQLAQKANKQQESWIVPTLQNGWSSGFIPAFRRDQFGVLEFRGTIGSGTTTKDTVLFTLPVGYRPTTTLFLPCVSYNSTSTKVTLLRITTGGEVSIYAENSLQYIVLNSPLFN